MTGIRVPVATYRLQLNRNLDFTRVSEITPYLQALGVTDIYASPVLKAKTGSLHGYDVTDPTRLNPELGGEQGFTALSDTLRQHGMGLLLDIVPNHMAASTENPWWLDVLENGCHSDYARYFDINWEPLEKGLEGRVHLPILGDYYNQALENGDLALELTGHGLAVRCHDRPLPLRPDSAASLLADWCRDFAGNHRSPLPARARAGGLFNTLHSMLALADEKELPSALRTAWPVFWHLRQQCDQFKTYINGRIEEINGKKGEPQSLAQLDRILAGQHYRLACWRTAGEAVNYRRFFDISDLIGIRMEKEEVFRATHSLILALIKSGRVTGLRIDHIDGLQNPGGYLERLQNHVAGGKKGAGVYTVIEKILTEDEQLPHGWPVHGTTGYDFLNALNGLFVYQPGIPELDRLYTAITGSVDGFRPVAYNAKKLVMSFLFPGEVNNLAHQLALLAREDRRGRDLTLTDLKQALVEVTACLNVYRTYITGFAIADTDKKYIELAVAEAVKRKAAPGAACRFLGDALLLRFPDFLSRERKAEWLRFVASWQQFTGPVMAKGHEDTALYRYNRLVSVNEVGGSPDTAGTTIEEFHRRNKDVADNRPHTINATSTHDTKRSEDVRARINVLSEIASLWSRRVEKWRRWNAGRKGFHQGRPVPDGNTELLIYQTLLGAWPLQDKEITGFTGRIRAYLVKAAREAKEYTSWLHQDYEYEKALDGFIKSILEPGEGNLFLQDFMDLQKIIAFYGAINSLGQVLLKIASPGIPDFYQGTELWNLSLTDPDNRRPVDFEERAAILARLKESEAGGSLNLARELLSRWPDGRIKLYVIYKALNYRRNHRDLFSAGEYLPLGITGPVRNHICAFARLLRNSWAVVIVPRFLARMQLDSGIPPETCILPEEACWGGSTLILPTGAPDRWFNLFTGETHNLSATPAGKTIPVAGLLKNFPIALLTAG